MCQLRTVTGVEAGLGNRLIGAAARPSGRWLSAPALGAGSACRARAWERQQGLRCCRTCCPWGQVPGAHGHRAVRGSTVWDSGDRRGTFPSRRVPGAVLACSGKFSGEGQGSLLTL